MSEPVVFISHFRVKEGRLERLRPFAAEMATELAADKPSTLAYLVYLDRGGSTMTVLHVFADVASMERHFEGSENRSQKAFEFVEPNGWEIYGEAGESNVATMRAAAASSGVALTLAPDYLAGFLRLKPA